MGLASANISVPQINVVNTKFCLPDPITFRGTYSTAPKTFTINTLTSSGTTATATVSANHNLNTGDLITISGAVQAEYNGKVYVTVTSLTQFTYRIQSGAVTPATGTIVFSMNGLNSGKAVATGTGTFAGDDFHVGDWLYDASQNALRKVSYIQDSTHWEFFDNFPSNASSIPVKMAPTTKYKKIEVLNTGSGNLVVCEATLPTTAPAVTFYDVNGLAPICGDATASTARITLQKIQEPL